MASLLLTYYADDFTGATDTLEALILGGVRAALFVEPPSPAQLGGRFAALQAVGVAGVSRAMTPAQMETTLRPAFQQLQALAAPLCHYKVCSTFDSSPQIGSIGRAIDIGFEVFAPRFVPLVVGAPALRRYVCFGNLFATAGEETFRLDRHPTMSRHPVTPMTESDLRRHLGRQTERSIALLDVLRLAGPAEAVAAGLEQLLGQAAEIVLFDTLDETHLEKVGRLIWQQRGQRPLFVVGSSGVEYALVRHWQAIGLVAPPPIFPAPAPVEQLIVMSGSASPHTAAQIDNALARGFTGIRLDAAKLVDPAQAPAERERARQAALPLLAGGSSLILYTAHGPGDPAIEASKQRLQALGMATGSAGRRLAEQQGLLLRALVQETGLRRACVAGGDTSGYAVSQLGIYALELLAPIAPGAPLCRASAATPQLDGLELALKGGQLGQPDYFSRLLGKAVRE